MIRFSVVARTEPHGFGLACATKRGACGAERLPEP